MKRFLSIFLAVFALLLAACTSSDEENENNSQGGGNQPSTQPEVTITAQPTPTVSAKGGNDTIAFHAEKPWSAKVMNTRADGWCSIYPTSGAAGDAEITITTLPNDTNDDRSATIIIQAGLTQIVTTITQKQTDALTITSSKFEVNAEGGEVEIVVKANVDYDYTIDPDAADWIKYKTTRTWVSSILVFEVAKNENMDKREAQILIHSGDLEELVTIYQEGEEPTIILSKNKYTVSDKGETVAVEVKSNVDVVAEIPLDVDWIKENTTRAMSTNTFYFDVAPNEDYKSRSAEVIFTNKENGLHEIVMISQGQMDAPQPKDNEIWYTTTDGKIVTPYATNVFGANIESNTYENGKGVIKFDGNVTIIGDRAFSYCTNLTNVTFSNSVTKIGNYAFQYCTNLANVTFSNNITKIGDYAFSNCSSLKSVTIPNSVTEIGLKAFYNCSSLTNVTIFNSVTEIGYGAFSSCSSLKAFYGKFASADNCALIVNGVLNAFAFGCGATSCTIPDSVTEIGREAFSYCSSLTNVTIPDSVIKIGDYAFEYCGNLTSITIPDSVTEIGDYAFQVCSSLKAFYGKFASADNRCLIKDGVLLSFAPADLTSYSIPDSVTKIGDDAFHFCNSLTSIIIPDSVTEIGVRAFSNCSSLRNVSIPNSVTEIGYEAFWSCRNLTSITIPDSVTEISYKAFSYCSSLTNVTIPDSVTKIGDYSFYNCTSLTNIYCMPKTPPTADKGNHATWNAFNDNAPGRIIYVPAESVAAYKSAKGWNNYANAIVGYDF